MDRVSASEAESRGFESHLAHQLFHVITVDLLMARFVFVTFYCVFYTGSICTTKKTLNTMS